MSILHLIAFVLLCWPKSGINQIIRLLKQSVFKEKGYTYEAQKYCKVPLHFKT